MNFVKHSVLVFRILKWVLLVSLAVFVIASTIGMILERNKAMQAAHATAQAAAAQSMGAVSVALWSFDKAAMDALLTGLVQSRSVVSARLMAADETIAEVRKADFSGTIDREWEIPVSSPDGSRPLGLCVFPSTIVRRFNQINSIG